MGSSARSCRSRAWSAPTPPARPATSSSTTRASFPTGRASRTACSPPASTPRRTSPMASASTRSRPPATVTSRMARPPLCACAAPEHIVYVRVNREGERFGTSSRKAYVGIAMALGLACLVFVGHRSSNVETAAKAVKSSAPMVDAYYNVALKHKVASSRAVAPKGKAVAAPHALQSMEATPTRSQLRQLQDKLAAKEVHAEVLSAAEKVLPAARQKENVACCADFRTRLRCSSSRRWLQMLPKRLPRVLLQSALRPTLLSQHAKRNRTPSICSKRKLSTLRP